jgi:small neutral amino acid transporter SnatA (MarC family)
MLTGKIIVAIGFGILVLPPMLSSFFGMRTFFEIPSLVVVIAGGIIYFYLAGRRYYDKKKKVATDEPK